MPRSTSRRPGWRAYILIALFALALVLFPDDEETRLQYAGGLPEDTGEESLAE